MGVAVTGIGTSFWHAPAFGTLAAVYPSRRATAQAVNRMGGSIGDSVSPLVVGVLLGGFTLWGLEWGGLEWQSLALLMVIPALLSATFIFFAYRGATGGDSEGASFRTYLESVKPMLTNSAVLSMTVLTTVRTMAHNALTIFIIIYMAEDLAFSEFKIGYHVALLTFFGIGFAPVMGWGADKIGRRPVIFVGLSAIAVLVFSLLVFNDGINFTIVLALLGLFLYSVNPIMLAAALDAAKKGTEGSATALVFTGGAIFGSLSPTMAGWLRQNYGMDSVFYFSAIIVAATAMAALFVPMKRTT
jgi:MFS family permease